MKILVLSDSHAGLSFMRRCVEHVKPDYMIHLGDHYDDGEALQEDYPHIPMVQVPGNCDAYRCPFGVPETVLCSYDSVVFFLTHGHNHRVKTGIGALLADARSNHAQVVLYGHTHVADCHREEDGLYVMNPGSCRGWGGSVGVIEILDKKVCSCTILSEEDVL